MGNLTTIILTIATFVNAITIILNFVEKTKTPVDKIVKKKFDESLEPVKQELKEMREDIQRLDKNQCKNYLTEFLEDLKKGVYKTDIEKQRATEVYDHYINELKLNSYIHSEWVKYMINGGKEK